MKIGLDIMGGDFAPQEAIKGAANYLRKLPDSKLVQLVLFGNQGSAEPYMHLLEDLQAKFEFVHADSAIEMNEHPTKALKEKPDSSIAIGFAELAKGNIDAFLSAGNTGAMMVGALYTVKAITGIQRPSIASLIPSHYGGYNLLLDVGANADCKPEHLLQFAIMGDIYARQVMKIENPKIGLLNIGEEEGKGNILAQATYPLLKQNSNINFVGNIEGRGVFLDQADVIVCDGFSGNILLKVAESCYQILHERRGVSDDFLNRFNYEEYGGTPILGINAPVIIGHGISNEKAFEQMISTGYQLAASQIVKFLQANFR